jgi:catechol 2,3-dioxygenase-like lactoylglutathione lyase family enzyme
MFALVTLRASDREASEQFYDTVLRTIGAERSTAPGDRARWQDFAVAAAVHDRPVTRGLHIGFAAPSRAHVDEFWRVGTAAGYRDDGEPGPRPQYRDDYYGAFLLDPDGNSAEAVHHGALRQDGLVDHLWIRVSDLAAAKRSYESSTARSGLRLRTDTAELVQFAGESGSFSLVPGDPTESFEIALLGGDVVVHDRA